VNCKRCGRHKPAIKSWRRNGIFSAEEIHVGKSDL
jgi:hypothetical protein